MNPFLIGSRARLSLSKESSTRISSLAQVNRVCLVPKNRQKNNAVELEREDFSVVVKSKEKQPRPWRWEIYRAGRRSPISRSTEYFATAGDATRAGKKALQLFLSEFPPS